MTASLITVEPESPPETSTTIAGLSDEDGWSFARMEVTAREYSESVFLSMFGYIGDTA